MEKEGKWSRQESSTQRTHILSVIRLEVVGSASQIAAPAFAMSRTACSNPPPLPTKKQQRRNEQALKARPHAERPIAIKLPSSCLRSLIGLLLGFCSRSNEMIDSLTEFAFFGNSN